jgi:hypothetical protein
LGEQVTGVVLARFQLGEFTGAHQVVTAELHIVGVGGLLKSLIDDRPGLVYPALADQHVNRVAVQPGAVSDLRLELLGLAPPAGAEEPPDAVTGNRFTVEGVPGLGCTPYRSMMART